MALIQCPECGREISDRSKQCIHCGFPLDEIADSGISLYRVSLLGISPNGRKIEIIKQIRLITKQGLAEAKQIADYPPSVIKSGISKSECESIKASLESAGATVAIEKDYIASAARNSANSANSSRQGSITCPYCGSANVSRISLFSRSVSTYFWGLGSSQVGKQWHCKVCDSDF